MEKTVPATKIAFFKFGIGAYVHQAKYQWGFFVSSLDSTNHIFPKDALFSLKKFDITLTGVACWKNNVIQEIFRGVYPLMSVRLWNFKDGGS